MTDCLTPLSLPRLHRQEQFKVVRRNERKPPAVDPTSSIPCTAVPGKPTVAGSNKNNFSQKVDRSNNNSLMMLRPHSTTIFLLLLLGIVSVVVQAEDDPLDFLSGGNGGNANTTGGGGGLDWGSLVNIEECQNVAIVAASCFAQNEECSVGCDENIADVGGAAVGTDATCSDAETQFCAFFSSCCPNCKTQFLDWFNCIFEYTENTGSQACTFDCSDNAAGTEGNSQGSSEGSAAVTRMEKGVFAATSLFLVLGPVLAQLISV